MTNSIEGILIQIQGAKVMLPMEAAKALYEDLHDIFGSKEAPAPVIPPVVPVYPPENPYWGPFDITCGINTSNVETYIK